MLKQLISTVFLGFMCLLVCSCNSVKVTKDPDQNNRGIRYYRPKPYLFVKPVATTTMPAPVVAEQTESKQVLVQPYPDGTTKLADGRRVNTNTHTHSVPFQQQQQVSIEIKYLPDFGEEYAIELKHGLGSGSLQIGLEDGWNLTSVNAATDQQTDELLTAIGGLATSFAALAKTEAATPDYRGQPPGLVVSCDKAVPIGLYESVFAKHCGRKRLIGWRYVGFAPIGGCVNEASDCNIGGMFTIVQSSSGLVFREINEWPGATVYENTLPYEDAGIEKPAQEIQKLD